MQTETVTAAGGVVATQPAHDAEVEYNMPDAQQLAQLSKKELEAYAAKVAAQIHEAGLLNQLEVYIRSKKLTDFATALAKAMQPHAYSEACKIQGKGAFDFRGATVTHTTTGSSYVYDNCNDPELKELTDAAEVLSKRIKHRQQFLQGVPNGGLLYIHPATGEEVTLRPPVKKGKEDISIKY